MIDLFSLEHYMQHKSETETLREGHRERTEEKMVTQASS